MNRHNLAETLAARDPSTKTDAIDVLLEALDDLDAIPHPEIARTITPIFVLRAALLDELAAQKEKIDAFVKSDAAWEERVEELEAKLAQQDSDRATAKIAELEAKLTQTEARFDAAAQLVDDYADMLALARRFVATAERAGLKARHARAPRAKRTT